MDIVGIKVSEIIVDLFEINILDGIINNFHNLLHP